MTPEMRARITAKNETGAAYGEVVRDAKLAGDAIAASGRTAAAGLRVEEQAMHAVARASRLAGMQQQNLLFQLNDVGVSLAGGQSPLLVLIQQGSQIATIWGPDEGGVGRAFAETGKMIGGMVTKFWPLTAAVAASAIGVAALTTEVNRNQEVQASWTDVVAASWQLASESFFEKFEPIVEWFGGLWDAVSPGITDWMVNTIANVDLTVRNIATLFDALPDIVSEAFTNAANGALSVLDGLTAEHKLRLSNYLRVAAMAMAPFGQSGLLNTAADTLLANAVTGNKLPNPYAGAYDKAQAGMSQNALDVANTDYVGLIGDRAREIATARALAEAADKAGTSLKAANDNGRAFEQMLADVSPLLQETNNPLTELQSNMDKLGALLAAGEISWEQYGEAVKRANLGAASGVLGAVGQITSALSQAFEDNKALAIANAVINTAEGVTKALAQGGMFGFASAAAIGISGAAQIASIMSARPGGGSVAAPSGGAVSAASSAPAIGASQSAYITLNGDYFSRPDVEQLLEEIADRMSDGGGQRVINIIKAA